MRSVFFFEQKLSKMLLCIEIMRGNKCYLMPSFLAMSAGMASLCTRKSMVL